jgi:hypothetical protein
MTMGVSTVRSPAARALPCKRRRRRRFTGYRRNARNIAQLKELKKGAKILNKA